MLLLSQKKRPHVNNGPAAVVCLTGPAFFVVFHSAAKTATISSILVGLVKPLFSSDQLNNVLHTTVAVAVHVTKDWKLEAEEVACADDLYLIYGFKFNFLNPFMYKICNLFYNH